MKALATLRRRLQVLAVGVGLLAGTGAQAAGLLTPADGSLPALEIEGWKIQLNMEDL